MNAQTLRSLGADIDETYPLGLRLDLSQPIRCHLYISVGTSLKSVSWKFSC